MLLCFRFSFLFPFISNGGVGLGLRLRLGINCSSSSDNYGHFESHTEHVLTGKLKKCVRFEFLLLAMEDRGGGGVGSFVAVWRISHGIDRSSTCNTNSGRLHTKAAKPFRCCL